MTSWDSVWDEIYRSQTWGKYPPEELIRFVARHYYNVPDSRTIKFLDLGCGYGSATWYLCREGFNVSAIDGSAVAIALLEERLNKEGLQANLDVSDATQLLYPDEHFDCVIDLLCLMCNSYQNTRKIIREVWRVLKPGGRLFSYTPQTGCWGDGIGEPIGENTYRNAPEGPFADMGTVRFSSEEDVLGLYSMFSSLTLDYLHRSANNRNHVLAFWVISGVKD